MDNDMKDPIINLCCSVTHTHAQSRFMALLDFVLDYGGEPVPER